MAASDSGPYLRTHGCRRGPAGDRTSLSQCGVLLAPGDSRVLVLRRLQQELLDSARACLLRLGDRICDTDPNSAEHRSVPAQRGSAKSGRAVGHTE